MTSRLRAILGGSNRVQKKRQTKPPPRKASPPKASGTTSREVAIASAASASSAAWSDALPRTKPSVASGSSLSTRKDVTTTTTATTNFHNAHGHNSNDSFTHALLTDLSLRDVPQAMRFAIRTMFTPLPDPPSAAGLHSTRVAELLTFRQHLPRLVTLAHLHGLLEKSSPTAMEREAASVIYGGAVRKVVILRRGTGTLSGGSSSSNTAARSSSPSSARGRGGKTPKERAEIAAAAGAVGGGVVELLIESAELYTLVLASSHLDDATKEGFVQWLKGNPTSLTLSPREAGLAPQQIDQLVRGGFLTTYHDVVFDELGHVAAAGMFARAGGPAMYPGSAGGSAGGINIGAIARAPTGSMEAVGGRGAVLRSGGGGGGGGAGSGGGSLNGSQGIHHSYNNNNNSELSVAVPGQGTFLKLRTAALVHLLGLLGSAGRCSHSTTPPGELTETMLRERWDGGTLNAHKRARREWDGVVLAGRTKKWKEFWGLGFAWVLSEARGAGLVEVFETGSVGRGVRVLV